MTTRYIRPEEKQEEHAKLAKEIIARREAIKVEQAKLKELERQARADIVEAMTKAVIQAYESFDKTVSETHVKQIADLSDKIERHDLSAREYGLSSAPSPTLRKILNT